MQWMAIMMIWLPSTAHGQRDQTSVEQSNHIHVAHQYLQTLASSKPRIQLGFRGRLGSLKRTLVVLLLNFNIHTSGPGPKTGVLPHSLRSRVSNMQAVTTIDELRGVFQIEEQSDGEEKCKHIHDPPTSGARRLEARLSKQMRRTCLDYSMIEDGDHIMVCISGGKDSATLLHLLIQLQAKLEWTTQFTLTAVHLNQHQPGYDNTSLVAWLNKLGVAYRIVSEDTYTFVKEKTPKNKAYCSLCSRLRRGILYSVAHHIGATKIALGHHADDAAETLLLNMIHQGQLKGMPARYYSHSRDAHVMRPLITCPEGDIASFAAEMKFPILPCNLCGSQPDLQRGQVKMLLSTLETLTPTAKANLIKAMSSVRPSHLLDQPLRASSGFDPITGQVRHPRATAIRGYETEPVSPEHDEHDAARDSVEDDPLLLL